MKKQTLLCPNTPLFCAAKSLILHLKSCGFNAWIVGGAPRDLLLGNEIKDIDIATDAQVDTLCKIFDKTHCVGAQFGVVVVQWKKVIFEVASLRIESGSIDGRHPEKLYYTTSIEEDASRRDFTINALYFDPINEDVFDCFTGFEDLEKGYLRTVGDPIARFNEDYLRMMRAIRFSARLGFIMDNSIRHAILNLVDNLTKLSKERLRMELTHCLLSGRPKYALEQLLELGVLHVILPEVECLRGCTQDALHHPEGDVFEHTALALESMPLKNEKLAWSILLHDICKPKTRSIDENGIIHFYLHEHEGYFEAIKILTRFKFDKNATHIIASSVKDHMRFFNAKNMKHSKLRHLFAMEHFPTTLELIFCDASGCHGDLEPYQTLCALREKFSVAPLIPAPLLNGEELKKMGLSPGPLFKEILSLMVDAQMEGIIATKEEARKWVQTYLETSKKQTPSSNK